MLYWVLVEQTGSEDTSDEYKNRCITLVMLKPPSWAHQTLEITTVSSPTELIKVCKSTGQTLISQTRSVNRLLKLSCILLVRIFYLYLSTFRNYLLISSPILKFGRFGKRQTCIISDNFLSSLRDIIQTSNREMYLIVTHSVSFLLVDSRYTGNTLHSDDLVQVVPISCITYFYLSTSDIEFRLSTFIP